MILQNSKYETVPPNRQKRQNLIWSTIMITLLSACIALVAYGLKNQWDNMPVYTLADDGEVLFIDGVELPTGLEGADE